MKTLGSPVDIAVLVYFRIAFGAVVLWEAMRYLSRDWIEDYWVEPDLFFTWWPLDFVAPWPGMGMRLHFVALAVLAGCVMVGALFRVTAPLLAAALTYVFLLDKAHYLNHIYLTVLLAWVLCALPAHRSLSVDAALWPTLRRSTAPWYALALLRFQIGVPYVFGGIAKLNADWLAGEPIRAWLARRTDFPVLGQFFELEPMVQLFKWGGLGIDMFVPFLLLSRRTRRLGYLLVLAFNIINSRLFKIGIFPWLMILGSLVFFPADWPRRLWRDLKAERADAWLSFTTGALLGFTLCNWLPNQASGVLAVVGGFAMGVFSWSLVCGDADEAPRVEAPVSRRVAVVVALWVLLQVTVPFRHLLIPGNVHWTEEGHRFAWHMKLREKDAETFTLWAEDRTTGERREVPLRRWLTKRQVSKASTRPDLIVQLAHHAGRELGDVAIYAETSVRLNAHPAQPLVDPTVDLTQIQRPIWPPAPWIMPFVP